MWKMLKVTSFVTTVCFSFGWTLWCWNDVTHAGEFDTYRPQTIQDHEGAILFAIARIALACGFAFWLFGYAERESKKNL